MAPKRTTGDAETVVRALLERWKTADDIDRHVSLGGMGQPPAAGAVPYSWLTWQGPKLLTGEYHAKYNAIRRAVARLEKAGEVTAYVYSTNRRYAWIVTEKCNNGRQAADS
jgi:hypothetical protein